MISSIVDAALQNVCIVQCFTLSYPSVLSFLWRRIEILKYDNFEEQNSEYFETCLYPPNMEL